jgi:hypothetical protein
MSRLAALGTLVLVLAAACRERPPEAGLSDDSFVEVVVALRQAAEAARGDAVAYTAARDEILAARNVTHEQLQQYVAVRSRDLAHFASVWERINTRLAEVDFH